MKKITISALIAIFLLTGCTKETPEIKLCKEVNDVIGEYEDAKISYNETRTKLIELTTKYCETEQYETCQSISMLKTHEENILQKYDCDSGVYATNESAHNTCLNMNKVIEESNSKVESAEHSRLISLGMLCSEKIDNNK